MHRFSLRVRFSLRTLFVIVTAIAAWLAWQIHVVRERTETLAWIRTKTNMIELGQVPSMALFADVYGAALVFDDVQLSWYRKLMDDRYVRFVGPMYNFDESEIARVQKTFPEAEVYRQ